jgi:hypothetical protein
MQIKITDHETLGKLPVIFRELKVSSVEKHSSEWDEQAKVFNVEFYQTQQYKTESHYKPISKIVRSQT